MTEIKITHWDKLTFNVMRYGKNEKVIEMFPALNNYSEFIKLYESENINANYVMRYIILFYDPGTPLRQLYDEIGKQKYEAACLAGFTILEKNFTKEVEDALYCNNKVVNAAIIRYLKILKNPKYSKMMIYHDALFLEMEKLRNSDGKTSDVVQNIDVLEKKVQDLIGEFLNGDMSPGLTYDLYTTMEVDELDIFPEQIAIKFNPL